MKTASAGALCHRLLEGVLLRLARRPDAGDFILRGGLLMRHWFRPTPRPVGDLDLIATFPFDREETSQRFLPVFADTAVADGVTFEGGRVEGIWLASGSPGVRIFVTGTAEGHETDFHVDVTFGPAPRPGPVWIEMPTACGEVAHIQACRPEAIVGQKVQALCHHGLLGWRPKDLNDLRLLVRLPMDDGALREAIAAYLADLGRTGAAAREALGPSWWEMKLSAARWLDFVRASRDPGVPRDPRGVVAEITARLGPVLESVP